MLILRGKPVRITGTVIVDGPEELVSASITIYGPGGEIVADNQPAEVSGSTFSYVHQTQEADEVGVYKAKPRVTAGSFTSPEEVYFILK